MTKQAAKKFSRFEGARVHSLRKNAEQAETSRLMGTKREGARLSAVP
jgi:hypothetical protein